MISKLEEEQERFAQIEADRLKQQRENYRFEHDGPGRRLYEAYRGAHNGEIGRVADMGRLPGWKKLKPKDARIWNKTAKALT